MGSQGLERNDGSVERIRSRSYPALQEAPAITQNVISEVSPRQFQYHVRKDVHEVLSSFGRLRPLTMRAQMLIPLMIRLPL